jgi:hypothetical protein
MKLKSDIKVRKGWRVDKILVDVIETLWMSLIPLVCGILFGLNGNLPWLIIGMIPLFIKFIYKRESDKNIIYLR